MFAYIIKAFKKEFSKKERASKWLAVRKELIETKWRLVEVSEVLSDRSYGKAMKSIRRRINRIDRVLEIAGIVPN